MEIGLMDKERKTEGLVINGEKCIHAQRITKDSVKEWLIN
jgi:hypothetical protein